MNIEKRMPVLFCGHGNPMNAIDPASRARVGWRQMGGRLGKPRAVVAISAHWATDGTKVRTASDNPQINDMYGFPDELYQVNYSPAADPDMAARALALLGGIAEADNDWGIDHGAWSVLCNLYPACDVPVVMISCDETASPEEMVEVGARLRPLRDEGALILASGNVVHNLRLVDWGNANGTPWADSFDLAIRDAVLERSFDVAVNYRALPDYRLAVPTPEHYLPLLAALGAACDDDSIEVFNDYRELASMSMTSYLFGGPAE